MGAEDVACKGENCDNEENAMRMSLLQKKEKVIMETSMEEYARDLQSLHDKFEAQKKETEGEIELDNLGKDYIAAQRKLSSQFEVQGEDEEGNEGNSTGRCHRHCGGGTTC